MVVEGVKGVKYTPLLPTKYKNGGKRVVSLTFWLKTLFFAQKYLTRYTPKTFFEEYINFNIFRYLVLWSYTCSKFRKSYYPQPTRLGLIMFLILLHTAMVALCTKLGFFQAGFIHLKLNMQDAAGPCDIFADLYIGLMETCIGGILGPERGGRAAGCHIFSCLCLFLSLSSEI
jgi:hypothetical protein